MTARDDDNQQPDDYLWNNQGTAPPDVTALQQALGSLRFDQPLDELRLRRRKLRWTPIVLGVAVLAAAAVFWLRPSPQLACGQGLSFVATGDTRCEGQASGSGGLAAGQWLETGDGSATITLSVGSLVLGPHSRLSVQHVRDDEQRLTLAAGRLSAEVIAPPRFFVVDTPRASVVDLGCAYTIDVDRNGLGSIEVTSGLVEFATDNGDLLVVAGTRARLGDARAVPFAVATDASFIENVEQLLVGSGPDVTAQIAAIIRLARPRDALTLVHLLYRTSGAARTELATLLANFVGLPEGVARERIVAGDVEAIARWREHVRDVMLAKPSTSSPKGGP